MMSAFSLRGATYCHSVGSHRHQKDVRNVSFGVDGLMATAMLESKRSCCSLRATQSPFGGLSE